MAGPEKLKQFSVQDVGVREEQRGEEFGFLGSYRLVKKADPTTYYELSFSEFEYGWEVTKCNFVSKGYQRDLLSSESKLSSKLQHAMDQQASRLLNPENSLTGR